MSEELLIKLYREFGPGALGFVAVLYFLKWIGAPIVKAAVGFFVNLSKLTAEFLASLTKKLSDHDAAHEQHDREIKDGIRDVGGKVDRLEERVEGMSEALGVSKKVDEILAETRRAREENETTQRMIAERDAPPSTTRAPRVSG